MNHQKMHKTFDEIMWPNKYLLNGLGIWPLSPNTRFHWLFNYFRMAIALSFITFMTYPLIVTITVYWGDIDILASFGCIVIMYVLGGLKVIYLSMRHGSFKRTCEHLKSLWYVSSEKSERASFEGLAILAQRITIISFASAVFDCVAFVSSPLILKLISQDNNSLSLPLPVLYGFNYDRTDIFTLLFIGQAVGSIICCMAIFGSDCTFAGITFHLAGQFRFISFRLQTIGQNIHSEDIVMYSRSRTIKDIYCCIAHHQRVICIVEEVNKLMEPVVFGQIATSGFIVCLCGFVIVTGNPVDPDMIKIYVFFTCVIAQLIIWCWPGELMIQESGAVGDTVCQNIPRQCLPFQLNRDLNMIVLRAQKECKISGFYQVMSMRKLTEVFNAAGSYMALLRSIRNP